MLGKGSCIETGASRGLNFPLVPKQVVPGLDYSICPAWAQTGKGERDLQVGIR